MLRFTLGLLISLCALNLHFGQCGSVDIVCDAALSLPKPPPALLNRSYLVAVHVLTRHGDRTPETPLPAAFAPVWDCDDANALLGRRPGSLSTLFRKRYQQVRPSPLPGSCAPGQLSAKGLRQHYALGQVLARKYAHELFGDALARGEVMARATNVDRTVESAEANLMGFFHQAMELQQQSRRGGDDGRGFWEPPLLASDAPFDVWVPPGPDPLLPPALAQTCPATFALDTFTNAIARGLVRQYAATFAEAAQRFDLAPQPDLFTMLAIHDGVFSQYCNRDRHPFTPPLNFSFVQQLNSFFNLVVNASYYIGTPLMIDPLLNLLFADWLPLTGADGSQQHSTASALPTYRYSLWSAHDATLGFLLARLGVLLPPPAFLSDPPYASHVEIELWRERDAARARHEVRVAYNGQYLATRACPSADPNAECLFRDWFASLQILTMDEWKKACG